jgi:hypothetical protein
LLSAFGAVGSKIGELASSAAANRPSIVRPLVSPATLFSAGIVGVAVSPKSSAWKDLLDANPLKGKGGK